MAELRYLDDDITRLYEATGTGRRGKLVATLFWGDGVRLVGTRGGRQRVALTRREWNARTGHYENKTYSCVLPRGARFRDAPVLKVRFVDVGQGDAAIVETPGGQRVLIDGGEEQHLRRYVNVAFSHVLRTRPLDFGAIVVTHGDADHFAGLTRLLEGSRRRGSPLATAHRVYHNGLVKRAAAPDREAFGRTVTRDGITYAVDLPDDLREVPDAQMNQPFRQWKAALLGLRTAEGTRPALRRIQYGADGAFDFLRSEGLQVRVLGPIVDDIGGRPGLRFLREPGSRRLSASHTINGHSIVLTMTFGNVRFLFGADLNEESEERLLERARADNVSLSAEILKVPHHGSADFSPRMLEAVRPVVSVISSGDESATQEYIHPRAGLVGALGKYSRATVAKPLVYATEMVAFFERLKDSPVHNAYVKRAFGIVHVRTDGERVLVATHSGRDDRKESYAFRVNGRGGVAFEPGVSIV